MNTLKNLLQETPEAYYWAGFIMADGSINHQHNSMEVGLAELDKGHVAKLAKVLGKKVYKYKHRNSQYRSQGYFYKVTATDNENMPKLIEKFDYKQKKTYNPPDRINIKDDNLFLAFLIGFIDGDGSINTKAYASRPDRKDCYIRIENHASWAQILVALRNRLYQICDIQGKHGSNKIVITKRGYAHINIGNSKAVCALKKVVEKFHLPVLQRKWKKIPDSYSLKYEKSALKI